MTRTIAVKLFPALFLTLGARAQSPVLCVYFTAGTVSYIPSHGPITPLDTHTTLFVNDKLTLSDNVSEVILFSRDTSYLKLEGRGTYTAAALSRLPRHRIRDPMMILYFSFFWQPAPLTMPAPATFVIGPRPGYATSQDSLIFTWHNVSWARKYFLRVRNPDGQLCYDKVVVDTAAVVHFNPTMPPGNSYNWAIDIVGEGGRLQFADSGHIVSIDETKLLPQLPALGLDSLGGIAPILEQIEQYENAGCIRQADTLFQRLLANSPMDAALDKLYAAFRARNYY